ncbi:helix-turn-helix domain-containing protein [Streptomyces ferralitis]|uniref:Helix-turn-helix domain-containing protein n=2 Tax=Streptantibioticus ferralitis TaxID=236510 RepID=A0ABT5Z934_9ACTN|nr:helix-turn-helix domain-containing protein [Streptantibioticus ferralitis]
MQRVARRGGTAQLLQWLAVRTGAAALLVNRSGVVASPPSFPVGEAERDLVLRGVREITARGLKSAAIDQEGLACVVLYLDGPPGACVPLLAAVMPRPAPPELPLLLADATSVLSLCWQVEHARRQQRRLRIADARTREAVLHLLMNGHTTAARQVAGALRPALPDVVRVYVIEGPPAARGTVAGALARVVVDTWIVPCPVYADHMMVLAPASSEAHTDSPPQWAWPSSVADTCWIGVSDVVPLRDTATGYAQAFHALAAARHRTERLASFAGHPDLALTIGPAAAAWAGVFLAPLHAHCARRSQDPDGTELLATAASWLSFSSRATAHLKIHRNTLTARLTLIQDLLGLDLNRLADQAALALALRTSAADIQPRPHHRTRGGGGTAPSLDELLALPHVVAWAQRQFHPLQTPGIPTCIAQTLTTWLRLDARIGPTAAALSLSASAVRKRLTRSEALLQRSLLRSPSAIHDQWLALRALDLA